jgi:DNA-directed RNA polymerase specialized sigma24 family protein
MDFPTTHWSVLAKATLHGEGEARTALEVLCQGYWAPVHSFVCFYGFPDAEAKDLTQEFMLHVLEKSIFTRADRLQGRFRSFLLGALTNFLSDAVDRRKALKRGGDIPHLSVDAAYPDKELQDPGALIPGVTVFDREWALVILETALDRLLLEHREAHPGRDFEVWKNFLPGAAEISSYEAAAARLGVSVPAFKSEIHRLRRRLRTLVRGEVARTVSAPHEIESEMAHLQRVLMDRGSEFGTKE